MKRLLCVLLGCALLLGAWGMAYADSEAAVLDTRSFVDSAGRTVEVPANIERIAPSGQLAQIALYSLAREKLVCLNMEWKDAAAQYIEAACLELPIVGQLYGRNEINMEELALADPQIIIDIGEVKTSTAEDMDSVQEQLGIPTVFIETSLAHMDSTFTMLGELLGAAERADALANYCADKYSYAADKMSTIEDKVSMVYCLGEQGTNVIANGSYHAELIDMFADNAAVLEAPSAKGTGNEIDFEILYQWEPEMILFAPEAADIYATAATDPRWSELAAIKTGNYYQAPLGPYNWIGFPPSVQRYLGMLWLGNLLYPDAFDYDLYQVAAEYFDMFYEYQLTREEFDALTANALPASDHAAA